MCTKIDLKSVQTFLASFFILFLYLANPAQAQDCGCDHIIGPEKTFIRATDMPEVKPGDVVCIKAGVRSRLKFVGFKGTKEQPIIFKNCGGQVIFDRTYDGTTLEGSLIFDKSQYFHVTGTGSPDHKYGFLIRKTNGSAVHATDSDYEFDHIEIADAGFAGFFTKIEALCNNTEYHRGNYTIRNVSIHDNYVHDTHGEGMYIGSSWWHGKSMECGTLYPPEIHGLRVYNNIIENTGADGMQIGCAAQDAEVYNNVIRNYGHNPFSPVHTNGLMLNGGFQGKVYNNKIIDGAGMGLNCFGRGNVYMYNNLVVRAGTDGIFIDERGPVMPGTGFHTYNNTVIAPKRDGIRMYSGNSTGNTFVNNIVVAPGSLGIEYYNRDHYLFIKETNIDYKQNNNLFIASAQAAGFVNAGGDDYQLLGTSPAVDKGFNLSYFNFDLNKTPRPNGGTFDIGAYEYSGAVRTTNALPTASAGTDQTITLPANTLVLKGVATDSDGTISSTQWTKLSGPAATLTGTSSLSLSLSNLVEGTYTFRLTATDNSGATDTDDVIVTVKAAASTNAAPTANAGTDKTITLPTNTLKLIGDATDNDGTISTLNWTKVSGPAATLSGQTTATLSLSALVEGTYVFRLTVADNGGATASDDVTVTVNAAVSAPNTAPAVSAGTDKSITLPTNSLSLSGSATDADGTIATTQWTKMNGPAATLSGASSLNLSLSNLLEGTYTFRLTATDNSGASSSDDVQIVVNAAPVVVAPAPAPTVANGINFSYYANTGGKTWKTLPVFTSLSPVKAGIVNNFDLSPKTHADNFGFVFEGLIEIAKSGTYTFFTRSDDGSTLFINDKLVVNNDGTHGVRERSGSIYLAAGKHPIKVNYFDANTGEVLEVSYAGAGITKQQIPDHILYPVSNTKNSTSEIVTTLAAPSNLTAQLSSDKTSVVLQWSDNSANEDGFEIYRGIGADGAYQVAGATGASKTAYTVVNLVAGQVYTFAVRAKNGNVFSTYSNQVQVGEATIKTPVTSPASGARVLVNFTYNLSAKAPWNNFNEDPDKGDKLENMTDEQGKATTISLTLLSPWGWAKTGGNGWNNYGMTTKNDSGVYPDEVMKSSFWTERTQAEEILVSGLTPGKSYAFTFFGSRDASGDRTTYYTIGKTTVSLNAAYNTSKTASISNAVADASGKLTIWIKKGENAPYGYLNAMVIEPSGSNQEDPTTTMDNKAATTGTSAETSTQEAKRGVDAYTAYPNPARDYVTLRYDFVKPYSKLQIKIVDLTGNTRLVLEETATDENGTFRIELDDDQMPTGYYIIQIRSEQSEKTVKFLKL